ncbi:PKD domain-containing protein [Parabacteroides sp. PF5-6]|uniref:PKD domain-containing protein n=1 Tax=Parabacteroides sp. PF5-6 TaxID=1742403 RepID=UPI002405ED78|nr:PKD domain-containing protein [Parabacteroides sp. PF5-6]MDF9831165.1 PKD repeat protein [Parabacteroides sp. PF5-6]
MKNILKSGLLALITLFALAACDPQESSDYSLGPVPQESQLSFTATPSSGKPNVIELKDASSVAGVAVWDLGNGSTAKGSDATAEYPFAGTYTVTLTLYTTGGSASVSQTITIAQDDMSLLDTPMYNALTGGAANLSGKTWVFDQYHDGHFGVGPATASTPEWWSCPAEGKNGSSLYTQEFTFTQVGVKLEWKNNGYVYANEPGKNALGGEFIDNPGGAGDFDVKYTPKSSYTFALNETDKTITLSDGAFFGFYTGSSSYDILSLTDDALYLRNKSAVESGNGWWFRLIPKEKNVKPDVTVELKAVPLSDDFENEAPSVVFDSEDIGELFSQYYQNPLPLPVNTSKRVCIYEKTTAFYSNIFFTADGYKFDLKEVNKVRLKVLIPSGNDYKTGFPVAGDWISNNKLLPQLAVKLQDSSKGGNAWETQVEIVKADLEMDKWLDLEFDFSAAKGREDFDKIVIQFGAEGHAAPGIFYFDDFSFGK